MNGRPDDEAPRIVVAVDGSGVVAVIPQEDRG